MPDSYYFSTPQGGGIVTISRTIITCPSCSVTRDVEKEFDNSLPKRGYWLLTCKGCKRKLGVTYDIRGDAVCWVEEESKLLEQDILKI